MKATKTVIPALRDPIKLGYGCIQFAWSDEPGRWRDYSALMVNPAQQLASVEDQYRAYRIPGSNPPVGIVWRIGTSSGGPLQDRALPAPDKQ